MYTHEIFERVIFVQEPQRVTSLSFRSAQFDHRFIFVSPVENDPAHRAAAYIECIKWLMTRKTANQVTRVLNASAFKKFLKGVPGVPSDVHKLIFPGPVFNFKVDLEPLNRYSFKV